MPAIFIDPSLLPNPFGVACFKPEGSFGAAPVNIEDYNSVMLLRDAGKPNYAAGTLIFLFFFIFFFILNFRISISSCYLRHLKRIILI
jgi:hypothetical protein